MHASYTDQFPSKIDEHLPSEKGYELQSDVFHTDCEAIGQVGQHQVHAACRCGCIEGISSSGDCSIHICVVPCRLLRLPLLSS